MSGIVGSYFNTRGSGIIAKLGTDGQVFTSTGAGLSQGFEDAAGGGAWNLIKQIDASSSATINFVNGTSDVVLDGTYQLYCIKMINVHPENDSTHYGVNFSDDTTSHAYDLVKTWTGMRHYMTESGTGALGFYSTSAGNQSTDDSYMTNEADNDADASCSGELWIYNPGGTTFSTHYQSKIINHSNVIAMEHRMAGYCNITGAVTAVQFKMASGDIDAGRFTLYGITT